MALFDARVGHPEIDNQHQAMLSYLTEFGSLVEGGDPGGASAILASFWGETVAHFALEEELMGSFRYPERDAHRTAHRLFLQDVQGLQRLLAEHGLTDELGVKMVRLAEWFAFHVETNDLPLAKFLSRRTAARAAGLVSDLPSESSRRSDA